MMTANKCGAESKNWQLAPLSEEEDRKKRIQYIYDKYANPNSLPTFRANGEQTVTCIKQMK